MTTVHASEVDRFEENILWRERGNVQRITLAQVMSTRTNPMAPKTSLVGTHCNLRQNSRAAGGNLTESQCAAAQYPNFTRARDNPTQKRYSERICFLEDGT